MIAKCFEVRDHGTFIPVLATCLVTDNEGDRYLIARAGFGRMPDEQREYVLLTRIAGGRCETQFEYFSWGNHSRTLQVAHKYIGENFDKLLPGAVIDVAHIMGETAQAKTSERYEPGCAI
jgi:hypothetical protein